jgi:hypothetical protein
VAHNGKGNAWLGLHCPFCTLLSFHIGLMNGKIDASKRIGELAGLLSLLSQEGERRHRAWELDGPP